MKYWFCLTLCLAILSICGCNIPKQELAAFNSLYEVGNIDYALEYAAKKAGCPNEPDNKNLLWTLQAGALERCKGNYHQSNLYFDRAEEIMNFYRAQNNSVTDFAAATVVNDNIIPYKGTSYDGIMVNTYKALNFIAIGDIEYARVEFNRALDRQRMAKEQFTKEIEALREKINSYNDPLVVQSYKNTALKDKLGSQYSSIDDFKVYPDFVNPFSTYMAGLFFALTEDYSKSVDLLKEAAGMLDGNEYILEDFNAVNTAINTNSRLPDMVWIIFENGLCPVKEEVRIDLPLFVVTDKVRYFGIALPQLRYRSDAALTLEIDSDGKSFKTKRIADMDRIIQTDFNKDFTGILFRAIISASAKAVAQYALEQNNNSNAAILMALYNFASTAADVRIWSALPKEFQVVRLPKPKDETITFYSRNPVPVSIKVSDCNSAIVYVKIVSSVSQPIIEVMKF